LQKKELITPNPDEEFCYKLTESFKEEKNTDFQNISLAK